MEKAAENMMMLWRQFDNNINDRKNIGKQKAMCVFVYVYVYLKCKKQQALNSKYHYHLWDNL